MPASQAIRPHGAGVRGIDLPRGSRRFEGRFGRMFRALPPADFSDAALAALAAAMTADPDPLTDQPDPEEGGIPAAFTYLGQFIDHDLTFDPASSLQRRNDPDALVDFRTPRFDLDSMYGRGPDDQPYLYEHGNRFALGSHLTGSAANPGARDLPRNRSTPARAIIGDPRNDENVIVSQLHGLFLRFHNHVAGALGGDFESVQREVRFHYQWVVLNDFLKRVVHHDVLKEVLPHLFAPDLNIRKHKPNLEFFHWRNEPFMPLEFSVAAYRFGHSMVRPGYRLNEGVGPLPIFSANPSESLTGFRKFNPQWAIDWNLFLDLEPRPATGRGRTQLAYKIDPSLVNPLGALPSSVASNPSILALRNLMRGRLMRLPSGQTIARAMGVAPLSDDQLVVGKFTGEPGDPLVKLVDLKDASGISLKNEFANNAPLWFYILAESVATTVHVTTSNGDRAIATRQLGPVGGRIVAEVFAGLMLGDSSSFLAQEPLWRPTLASGSEPFGLRELVRAALQD
jgi:hypothetical protein